MTPSQQFVKAKQFVITAVILLNGLMEKQKKMAWILGHTYKL